MSTTTAQRPAAAVTQDQQDFDVAADAFIHEHHIGHGSTPAAWTLSITLIIGSIIAGVGFVLEMWFLAWIGAACAPLALILGLALKKAGYGVEQDSYSVLERDPARNGR